MFDTLDDQSSTEQSRLSTEGNGFLQRTTPWLQFMGVVLIIFGTIGVLGRMITAVSNAIRVDILGLPTVVTIVMSGLAIFMGTLLLSQANAYNHYLRQGDGRDMDIALKSGYSYWLTLSVITMVYVIFIIAFIIIFTIALNDFTY